MEPGLEIIHEDNHLLAVAKRAGIRVQGDDTGDVTLHSKAKEYLKRKYEKPGGVFLGIVHRLDRPVSGLVLFARTSKAASRLARAFRERKVQKTYLAIVLGMPDDLEGTLKGGIVRAGRKSRVVSGPSGREAVLRYKVIAHMSRMSLLQVTPETGRHHQIRAQLAHAGYSVAGDVKYGAPEPLSENAIALHAWKLSLRHPVRDEELALQVNPPSFAPWDSFADFY